jgi:hypothetical protein
MLVWCFLLLLLGIAAFLDSVFNYGEVFRRANSITFMLVSLGLLIRTTIKIKKRRIEGYIERMDELTAQIREAQRSTLQASSPHRTAQDTLETDKVENVHENG